MCRHVGLASYYEENIDKTDRDVRWAMCGKRCDVSTAVSWTSLFWNSPDISLALYQVCIHQEDIGVAEGERFPDAAETWSQEHPREGLNQMYGAK